MPQLTVDARQLPAALLVAGVSALVYFLAKFYVARRQVWKMQRDGLPMPPFSFLAGHFPVLGKIMRSLPPDSIIHNIMWRISEDFPGGIYYINLWPFAGTVMVISDADAASQLEGPILAKGADIVEPLERITGGRSLLTMQGGEWKRWRRLFNPGFSPSYMMGLAPAIADEVAVFRKNLLERCLKGRSDVFQLEELTLKLTFDIIGSVVLDAQLRNQLKVHHLAEALRKQVEWTSMREPLHPLTKYLTVRPLVQWFNGRRLDRYVAEEIDHRLAERFEGKPSPSGETRSKSVASLFIDEYLKEFGDEGLKSREVIKKIITPQVRLFLFAGHDTTSGTLQYCYYVLSQYPQVHSRVVAEVDDVFGPDASLVQDKIHDDPQVLNRIPYTTAFIKEVLRIFPPAAAMRQGQSDVNIVDADGRVYPTVGCNVWTLSLAIHRNPRHWKDPDVCVPERWLVGPEDPLYPPKGAWRPFEWGPRSCIGQTLAMVELRVALVMTAREFNIKPAYDEWDRIHLRRGIKTVNGDRAYQAVKGGGGAHPADGFPVTVELRET
ncbi:putative sterigmatocystin biosynthesis P450 monooxygenase stcS [Colletotrichum sidae]|uniref:Putative sterigmatocystin biosynthesis P450 monooxygenase stcS n=1 Tax=Colletotrichum sidae TaxID=1347389 RepID=A0A4R8TLS5_9PEZI|nr:putative sterigmatocystin biosynthesis P450 monooxygenase stcS [Colletotrichum sidae]